MAVKIKPAAPLDQMTIERVMINPAMAIGIMEANKNNRPVTKALVEALTEMIRRGHWLDDGQPYRIGTDGRLLDGQKRLSAIIYAGATVPGVIIRGIDPAAQVVMDTGQHRNLGQTLAMHEVPNASRISTVVNLMASWDAGIITDPQPNARPYRAPQVLLDLYFRNEQAFQDAGRVSQNVYAVNDGSSIGALGAAHMILGRVDNVDRDTFFRMAGHRESPSPAVVGLHRFWQLKGRKPAAVKGYSAMRWQLAHICQAWNAFREDGQSTATTAVRPGKPFPVPQ